MSIWDSYPSEYRAREVQATVAAVTAGESVSIIGLSGAGKSNLLGFMAYRVLTGLKPGNGHAIVHPVGFQASQAAQSASSTGDPWAALIDCNRLTELAPAPFFRLVRRTLGDDHDASDELGALDAVIERRLAEARGLCLLFDRFDAIPNAPGIPSNLRALRENHNYELTYITATRRPLNSRSELAELFFAHTLWLGPLSEMDARWNVTRYAERHSMTWDAGIVDSLIRASWGYPSLLRAACEAVVAGCPVEEAALREHAAIRRRVDEFWADAPSDDDLRRSGLAGHPWLGSVASAKPIADAQLTAKEHLLLEYFRAHPDQVCEKDDLIHAVWPEDKIYERGVRDDSLAQLIRRLREKIEPDASAPHHIHTVPGRGYRYTL